MKILLFRDTWNGKQHYHRTCYQFMYWMINQVTKHLNLPRFTLTYRSTQSFSIQTGFNWMFLLSLNKVTSTISQGTRMAKNREDRSSRIPQFTLRRYRRPRLINILSSDWMTRSIVITVGNDVPRGNIEKVSLRSNWLHCDEPRRGGGLERARLVEQKNRHRFFYKRSLKGVGGGGVGGTARVPLRTRNPF